MKKLITIVCFIPAILAGCKNKCIEDSGNHIEKSTTVAKFDKINISGAIKLILTQDSSYTVKIATDSNLMEYIKADVSGSQLNIKMKNGSYCGTDSIVIEAGIAQLKALTAAGAVRVRNNGRINTGDIKLDLSGTTEVALDLDAANLTSNLDGVSKLKLAGQGSTHKLTIQGNADIDAFDFIAGAYNIEVTGSAKANINVLNELTVKTEGASEIYYRGNPKKINEKKSGDAKLEKVN